MTLYHPPRDQIRLEDVLAALGHPIRLQMVRTLRAQGECPCSAVHVDVTKSTATHHWRVLREAGVVCQRPEGRTLLTSLRSDDLGTRFPGLMDVILNSETAKLTV